MGGPEIRLEAFPLAVALNLASAGGSDWGFGGKFLPPFIDTDTWNFGVPPALCGRVGGVWATSVTELDTIFSAVKLVLANVLVSSTDALSDVGGSDWSSFISSGISL